MIVPFCTNIDGLLQNFNKVHDSINFTVEEECGGVLPFLDVKIMRTGEQLEFAWYHKPCWTGQLLHFQSFVPLQWKIGLLKGLKYRLLSLCSPNKLLGAVEEMIAALRNNGYPSHFIHEHFESYVPALKKPPIAHTVPKLVTHISLPFLGDTSSTAMIARIGQLVERHFVATKVVIRHKVSRAYGVTGKDKLTKGEKAGVVYKFTCDCHETYIGRTEQRLKQRLKQHLPKWATSQNKKRPRSNEPPNSSITKHVVECNSLVGETNFKILHQRQGKSLNRILEALHIRLEKPSLCVQKEYLYELQLSWT